MCNQNNCTGIFLASSPFCSIVAVKTVLTRENEIKRRAIDNESFDKRFRDGLFVLSGYQKSNTDSES